jgi:outer membrane cobalamin receptor
LTRKDLTHYLILNSLILILFHSFVLSQFDQSTHTPQEFPDSIPAKIISIPDSSSSSKLTHATPIRSAGSIETKADFVVYDSTFLFSNYKYAGNILEYLPGIFINTLGSVGQPSGLITNGLQSIVFLNNSAPLNDPLSGTYNIFLYPTEHIERVEYIGSVNSFYYSLNSNSGVINFIPKSFKSLKPYSKIRYSESAYDETFFDGMVSQNLLSNLNFNVGVQRTASNGMFANTGYDAWNARSKIRYDISSILNIWISEIYNQNLLGLNGGVDLIKTPDQYLFDPLQATVNNSNSYEKVARNDLQIGAAAKILADSNSTSNVNFYLSNNFRRYRDKEVKLNYQSRWMGFKFNQHIDNFKFGPTNIISNSDFGFELQTRQIKQGLSVGYKSNTILSLFGKTEFETMEELPVKIYIRNENFLEKNYLNLGASLKYMIHDAVDINFGYSVSHRFPTFQENYWRDSTISGELNKFNPEKHKLWEVRINLHIKNLANIQLTYFNRFIKNAIIPISLTNSYPIYKFNYINDDVVNSGFDAGGEIKIWKLTGIFNSRIFVKRNSFVSYLPKTSIVGELSFRDHFFKNNLDLKFGFQGRAISRQKGVEFNPLTLTYIQSPSIDLNMGGSLDVFIIGRIGSAVVHFIFENVLNDEYVVTKFYPIQDRSLRFGITWEFEN